MLKELTIKKKFFLSLPKNEEFIKSLTKLAEMEKWPSCSFEFIGALSSAEISEYNQKEKKYTGSIKIFEDLEILLISGSITTKNDSKLVHAHASLSYNKGQNCIGGHLLQGSIFVVEGKIEVYNEELIRSYDEDRGLFLF